MTYDQWKTDSGYDEDPCEHEDYEVDIIVGRAHCCSCPHSWWQTNEETAAEVARIAAYDEWLEEQERPWNFKEWVLGLWPSISRRRKRPPNTVDDLPF